jgi:glycosyltransferase involved in cell wall biosynthesis
VNLITNTVRISHWSRGVQRYFSSVMKNLNWENDIENFQPRKIALVPERFLELVFRGSRDSIVWSPCPRGPVNAHNHVVTVHDCINLEYVLKNQWRRYSKRAILQRTFDNAARIIAISDSTKNAILRNYDVDLSKLAVIKSSCEVGPVFQSYTTKLIEESCHQSKYSDDKPYILMVTNPLPHKNTMGACQALINSRAGKSGISLRVVGSLSLEAHEICQRNNFLVTVEQDLTDLNLARLYTGCLFLLSPSLAEGHNLPIAEALYFGARVLCSDIEAHREFYEGKVEYFDPLHFDAMTIAIDQIILGNAIRPSNNYQTDRSQVDVAKDYKNIFKSICCN